MLAVVTMEPKEPGSRGHGFFSWVQPVYPQRSLLQAVRSCSWLMKVTSKMSRSYSVLFLYRVQSAYSVLWLEYMVLGYRPPLQGHVILRHPPSFPSLPPSRPGSRFKQSDANLGLYDETLFPVTCGSGRINQTTLTNIYIPEKHSLQDSLKYHRLRKSWESWPPPPPPRRCRRFSGVRDHQPLPTASD